MARKVFLTVCIAALCWGPRAGAVENLLLNGSFEDTADSLNDDQQWGGWQGEGAQALFLYDKDVSIDGKRSVQVEIAKTSQTDWHIGLQYTNLSLKKGKQYTFTVWARAAKTRPAAFEVKRQPGGGLPWQGVTDAQFTIAEEWAEYRKGFIPQRDYPEENGRPASLHFWLATDKSTIWFDFAHLYQGQYETIRPSKDVGNLAVGPAGRLAVAWGRLKGM
jgi:hypothetical protein